MTMNTSIVVERGRSGAERVAGTIQQLPPVYRIVRRRKSRTDRVAEAFQSLSPAVRVGLVAAATGVAIGLAYVGARLFAGDDSAESPDAG
jgi:hypothetical protein